MKNNSGLFYTCSLIELLGRECKQPRKEIVNLLGKDTLTRLYKNAGILHCEPIEKVADDYITMFKIPQGTYDNAAKCRYTVPDYRDIGEVYSRLIEDTAEGDIIDGLISVYNSDISDAVSNYNSDFYYQSRDYIKECYLANEIL